MKPKEQIQDKEIKKRIKDIQTNPSIGRTEKELLEYLEKRGVKTD